MAGLSITGRLKLWKNLEPRTAIHEARRFSTIKATSPRLLKRTGRYETPAPELVKPIIPPHRQRPETKALLLASLLINGLPPGKQIWPPWVWPPR